MGGFAPLIDDFHDDALAAFARFWREEDESVGPMRSAPLAPAAAPNGSQRRRPMPGGPYRRGLVVGAVLIVAVLLALTVLG